MLGCVVDILDIFDVNHSATISIKLLVGFLDQCQSRWSQFSSDDSNEFIVADSSVSVYVEGVEDNIDVFTGDLHSEVLDGLSEFIFVKTL